MIYFDSNIDSILKYIFFFFINENCVSHLHFEGDSNLCLASENSH